jgi:LSD1 subclass zinc finger protein
VSRTVNCPKCRRPLALPDNIAGKKLRCWACQAVFTLPDAEAPLMATVLPVETATAPSVDERLSLTPCSPVPARSYEGQDARGEPVGISNTVPVQFKAVVRKDPDKALKGNFQCRLSSAGLSLRQGKKEEIAVGIGTAAKYDGSNRFTVPIEGRAVEFAVAGWGVYRERLARDLCAFLAGERSPLSAKDYRIPAYLFVPAVLPLGIPLLTLGGALWGALGFGLAGGCLAIVRREQWPTALRLILALLLAFAGYGVVGGVLLLSSALQWFAQNQQTRVTQSPQEPARVDDGRIQPLAQQEWGDKANGKPWFQLLPNIDQPVVQQGPAPIRPVELRMLTADKANFVQVAFSSNGKTLAALDLLGSCRLWDRGTGERIVSFRLAPHNLPNFLTFSPDGKYLVAWDSKVPLCLRDAATGEIRIRIDMDPEDPNDFYSRWTHADFTPDSKVLAVSRGRRIRFWTVPEGKPADWPQSKVSEPGNYFYSLHFAPDGKSLMTVSYTIKERGELDRLDQVWDLEGKSSVRRLSGFRPGQIWDRFTFSPDRKLAVLRTFHFAEVHDWLKDKGVVNLDGEANCNSVAVTPDGKTLLMGHGDGKVGLWELPTGKTLGSFQIQLPRLSPPEGVYLAVSPDSQMLAAAHGSTITLWKLDSILRR